MATVWCGVSKVWCGVVYHKLHKVHLPFATYSPVYRMKWCDVVWCDVVWCGVVGWGVALCGVVWCGMGLDWGWQETS